MIISNQQVRKILGLPTVQARSAGSGVVAVDNLLQSSTPSAEMRLAREQIFQTDDIRFGKVGELKKQIREGGYQISSDQIATKMLSRSLVDVVVAKYL